MIPTIRISNKADIIHELDKAYQTVLDYVLSLDQDSFVYSVNDKWSVSEQLEHLILSSKGIPSALNMPKEKLLAFGKTQRPSRSYDELYKIYKDILNTGVKAPLQFSPDAVKNWTKKELEASWVLIGSKFTERIPNWSEEELNTYQVPHPAFGLLTMREILLFTIFHTYHHLRTMKLLFEFE